MYEDDQKNNLYIGNLVEGSRFRGYCAAHAGVTQAVCTLITLIIFLELYASMFAARNFFAAEQTSYNPLKIFFGMGDHPVAGIIVLALSVITGKILTSVIINEKDDGGNGGGTIIPWNPHDGLTPVDGTGGKDNGEGLNNLNPSTNLNLSPGTDDGDGGEDPNANAAR